jgi:hypothetical protein
MSKQISIPVPEMAPFGGEIGAATVQEIWDTFVKPDQLSDAPQSVEMRALMGVLRAVFAGLEAAEQAGDGPQQAHTKMQRGAGPSTEFYCLCGWTLARLGPFGWIPRDARDVAAWLAVHIDTARGGQA